MNLGKRIKALRKDQGWTQSDLAKRTSLSRGRLAQIETDPLAANCSRPQSASTRLTPP